MSITYKFYCIESTMKKVTALDKRYATFRVTEIPNVKISYRSPNDCNCGMHYYANTVFQSTANVTDICGTVYYIVLRIALCKISAKEMRMIYSIINEGVYKYWHKNNAGYCDTLTPWLTLPKNECSAICFTIARARERISYDVALISGKKDHYEPDNSIINSSDRYGSYSGGSPTADAFRQYSIYVNKAAPNSFPIVIYTFILLDPYDQKCIAHLKKVYAELTNDAPLIDWNDETMEYVYRTDDRSPFINKKELEELIYKLEHDEDVLPLPQTPAPTKETDLPKPVKRSSSNMEPGRIRSRKPASPSKIKEAIKETTGYANPYEGLDESLDDDSSSDESTNALIETLAEPLTKAFIDTSAERSEPKTKIDPKILDCIASDYEPVKPLRLTTTAENVNIFLVVYAFIMTVLVTIGMVRR